MVLSACPTVPEESWRRTDPELFFLPSEDVCNVRGQNALEVNPEEVKPWKVYFHDLMVISPQKVLTPLFESLGVSLNEEVWSSLSVSDTLICRIENGNAHIYMGATIRDNVEISSRPWAADSLFPQSPIGAALGERLHHCAPYQLCIRILHKKFCVNSEKFMPFVFLVGNDENPMGQNYASIHLSCEHSVNLMTIDCIQRFSHLRYTLEVSPHVHVQHLWVQGKNNLEECNSQGSEESKTLRERTALLKENSILDEVQIFAPAGKVRISSRVVMAGDHAVSTTNAAVLSSQGHFDYEPWQHHTHPQGTSKTDCRMVLAKRARAIFQGLVVVDVEAQDTQAFQENKNLLLSPHARVDSLPRLDILPSRVLCKHGSATATLSEREIYYLQSRGFDDKAAQHILVEAFVRKTFPHRDHPFFEVVQNATLDAWRNAHVHLV